MILISFSESTRWISVTHDEVGGGPPKENLNSRLQFGNRPPRRSKSPRLPGGGFRFLR
jgi:hypothetical protein